ncbi:MAG: DNA gyrase subunit A [Clostridium sp.]|uniref:DNA gyrase subunit A n=1 Tax=Clostridium sp. TaxID=1506 RepID=UPI003EE7B7ED
MIEPPIEDITDKKDITKIIEDNMMEYSSDVILDRALASVESGLKPSQLRSLWTMYTKKYFNLTKSLNVSGAVTQYHSHGSVYPTVVKMSQEDRHHLPLIIGDGNFGQYTSKLLMEASDRYTNVKLSELAIDSLKEVDKHYVEMIPTYDGKKTMPLYLPSKYPIILTQASEGMAVGMASTMPSFNFNEVCNAIIKYIETNEKTILVPDFATYGYIRNNESVINTVNTKGKGTLKLRGKCIRDEEKRTITITEVPYGVYREDIINRVIELIKEGKLKEINSIKDSTGLKGMGIKVECKKNTNLEEVENKLYAMTPLESSFSCNMNVLTNGMPKVLGVWEIIDRWIDFRKSCITNGLNHEKNKYEKELHLLKGYSSIVSKLDELVNTVRYSKDIITDIVSVFGVDTEQAKYISKLQLTDINEKYIKEKLEKIKTLEDSVLSINKVIESKEELLKIVLEDIKEINSKYKTPRRTQIIEDIKQKEDILIEDYNVQFVLTRDGYFKKIRLTSIKSNSTHRFKDGDVIISERNSSNKADLLIFTSKQNCYKLKANDIPDHKTSVLGLYLPSHLQLEENEYIVDIIPTIDYKEEMLVAFNTGRVVRLPLSSYETKTNRTKLIKALHTDKVIGMEIIDKEDKYLLESSIGRAMIFNSKDIMLKISKSSQGISVMKHKEIEIINFVKASTVNIDNISKYLNCRAGKPLQLLGSTNEIKE